jgi:trehalose 6-phosphate phosphatase
MAGMTQLPAPQRDWALFFDIDGTLIELAPTPDAVIVPAALRDDLASLYRRLGAVALVSGRPLTAIDGLFAPLNLPASGQHGAEARIDGERFALPPPPSLRALVMPLKQFAADHHGILIEDKGNSIAVHYRAAPTLAADVKALTDRLVAGNAELEALPAHMAVDIKSRATSKGDAIGWFMARPPFAGRIPVFVGDDRTDEAGFAAVNERGGHSIRVGDRADSAARFLLNSSAAVREWVAGLARYYSHAEGP